MIVDGWNVEVRQDGHVHLTESETGTTVTLQYRPPGNGQPRFTLATTFVAAGPGVGRTTKSSSIGPVS